MAPFKRCTKCGELQPLTEFYAAKGTRDGLRGDCKMCFKERAAARYRDNPEPAKRRAKEWAKANPDRVKARELEYRASGRKAESDRKSHLKRAHGLSLAEYAAMLDRQGGLCAICGKPPGRISLHVDHDHETGRVRGLVDFKCNNALGDFDDDPARLRRAAAYLEYTDEDREFDELARARAFALRA